MSAMGYLVRRNLLIYFKDRASVLFSLMAVFIVLLLYLLFLRNMLIDSISDSMSFATHGQLSSLVDSWVFAGILGIVSVTASAGSLQCMVDDNLSGRKRDFIVTSIKPYEMAGGYIISTFLVGLIMGLVALIVSLIYLSLTGCPLDITSVALCVALLIPSSLSGSIIIFAMISRIKSAGAFSGFFTVISVLIGFLTGIYMPMGTMADAMQFIGTLVPATHMAALFRQNLCSGSMDDVFGTYDASEFRHEMGFDLSLGGYEFSPEMSLMYVLAVTAVFFVIAVFLIRRTDE
ncbi:MAG: ABC transporter permease [Candidatus Methanomethylophilaceae archaeon]|nr:ABC transporter permease [Candidatus Methanomethylophilaceae archaeon]